MANYTASAPASTVPQAYRGAYGALGTNKFTIAQGTGTRKAICVLFTGVGAYTTGGDAITMTDLPLTQVRAAYVVADTNSGATQSANTAFVAEFDLSTPTAPKIKWYSGAATELGNAASVAGRTLLVRLEGV